MVNSIFVRCLVSLATITVFVSNVGAANMYMGGAFGKVEAESTVILEAAGSTVDQEDSVWKIYAGLHLTDYFAVEGAYVNLGDASVRFPNDSNLIIFREQRVNNTGGDLFLDQEVETWSIQGLVRAPLGDQVGLFVKYGYHFSETTGTENLFGGAPVTGEDGESRPVWGVGFDLGLSSDSPLKARFEYERYSVDRDLPMETLFVGLQVGF